MSRALSILIIAIFISILSGCGPIYRTQYAYVPPRSQTGQMCIAQCLQTKSMAEQMCQLRNETCKMQAHQDALYQYREYRHEQRKKGEEAIQNISDFDRSSWQCNDSCDASGAFNSCYQACGGQVLERQVCTAFCDRQ